MILDPTTPDRWPTPQTPYEADTLAFCQAWLSDQPEFTLHTSGSTGIPKPIQLTRTQMRASAHLTGKTLGLKAGDAALVCLNIHYVVGVMMLVRGLELGLPMAILEPSDDPLATLDPATTSNFQTWLIELEKAMMCIPSVMFCPFLNKLPDRNGQGFCIHLNTRYGVAVASPPKRPHPGHSRSRDMKTPSSQAGAFLRDRFIGNIFVHYIQLLRGKNSQQPVKAVLTLR